jgi:hypothetical protein
MIKRREFRTQTTSAAELLLAREGLESVYLPRHIMQLPAILIS